MKKISIVTPVYNEEDNIGAYFERMNPVLQSLSTQYNFEFIFTDNRSTDKTFEVLSDFAKHDTRIKVYRFSKNYGYQKSILTGYQKSTGDAAIEFDCDLQDPPELLPKFLQKWEEGNKIVYGIREHRPEGAFVTFLRKIFYRLIRSISENDLPNDAGDFMLIDRRILNHLQSVRDQNLYLRGLIFGFGFKKVGIPYTRDARVRGQSKFPLLKMVGLALDGIVSQSTAPLKIASFIGFSIAGITLLLSAFYLALKIFESQNIPAGFTTNILLILFSISLNAIFLGIIGEYLARLYIQSKSGPLTIIDESIEPK